MLILWIDNPVIRTYYLDEFRGKNSSILCEKRVGIVGKTKIAIIGLGFGAEFIPIYMDHPQATCAAVCKRNATEMNAVADQFGVEKRYTDFHELLRDPEIDAIHINTPIADHAWMAIEGLKAGKHVACTVPMAITVDECLQIIELERQTGKVYMMMETAAYTREFLYVKNLFQKGEMGDVQFLRGSHQQNMGLPGWPAYWYGFPPMFYATHAVAPLADLIGKRIKSVRCYGSGRISPEYQAQYQSPFAVETSQMLFEDSAVACEVTRSLFDTIRQYRESFDVYGTKMSFEWEQTAEGGHVLFSGFEDARKAEIEDTDAMLPGEIAKYALRHQIVDEDHVSFIQGAGHGGSHPHLVHEFVSAIREGRKAHVSAEVAANWTMAGILSHESAMKGGQELLLPR